MPGSAALSFGSAVGDRLRLAREEKGRSLRQVAGRAGVGRSTLSRWERGQTLPNGPDLERLYSVLGIETDSSGFSLAMSPAEDTSLPATRSRRRLLRAIRMRSGRGLLEAAAVASVSKATLSRWESGDRWPGRLRLAEAAKALGASDAEVRAIESEGPLSRHVPHEPATLDRQVRSLRDTIATGQALNLDLCFLGLDEALSESGTEHHERLRLELRATYIEWLGWWYRDEEAGLLACRLLKRVNTDPDAQVWGRVLRAACNYYTEVRRDVTEALDLLESTLPGVIGRPSEAYVRRELAGIYLNCGEPVRVSEMVKRARDSACGEETQATHRYCCDMIEASLLSASGRHDSALGKLPTIAPTDPYLIASSAVGTARILECAGMKHEAASKLSNALDELAVRGLPHFARGLQRRLALMH
jgi:transcriptional regulator with XRE-family HTH domain